MKINRPKVKIKGTSPYQSSVYILGLAVVIPKVDKIGRTTYFIEDARSNQSPDLEAVVFIRVNSFRFIITNRKDIYAVKRRFHDSGSTFGERTYSIPVPSTYDYALLSKMSKECYERILEKVAEYVIYII